jgi:hypothetical protein
MKSLKEYFKNNLKRQLAEELHYPQPSSRGRVWRNGKWVELIPPDSLARGRGGTMPFKTPQTPEDERTRRSEEQSNLRADHEKTRNLLNAVNYYSRLGVSLGLDHVKGIDFSQGTIDDHVDQISKRLPPMR